jgi:tetrahydromethanopterin S-methyltransferase subunit G
MSIINQDQKRLDNIAKAYWNTSGEMREMWGRKWYELIKQIGRKIDESKRLSTSSREIH